MQDEFLLMSAVFEHDDVIQPFLSDKMPDDDVTSFSDDVIRVQLYDQVHQVAIQLSVL